MKNAFTLLFLLLLVGASPAVSSPVRAAGGVAPLPGSPLRFSENKGQVTDNAGRPQPHVLFTAQARGVKVFLTKTGITYTYFKEEGFGGKGRAGSSRPGDYAGGQTTTYQVDMHLVGADPGVTVRGEAPTTDVSHYYLEHCPGGITGVRNFGRVVYENVYPRVDLVLYVQDDGLKYDFVVKPGGRVGDIRLRYAGSRGIALRPDGSLDIRNPLGKLAEGKPFTYQRAGGSRREVSSAYRVQGDTVGFAVDANACNPALPLVIDPTLVWGTYYGGSGEERIYGVATDAAGNVFMAGETTSLSGISDAGHQATYGGSSRDAFLVKFNAAGQRLWATYYGGSGSDEAMGGVATDAAGNAYLAGSTISSDNIGSGGFLNTRSVNFKAFLVKFTPGGTRLWGTYYGGEGSESGLDVCTDPQGNVYLAGLTLSNTGIASPLAHQVTRGNTTGFDVFLAKFDPAGGRLWATYYGGTENDDDASVATDPQGNVYLAGTTGSANNIASGDLGSTFNGGGSDAFLAKFNAAGVRQWGRFFGTGTADKGKSIATDAAGNVYLSGDTYSTTGLASVTGHQYGSGGSWDGFLAKFSTLGYAQWSTYYGGANLDQGECVATDGTGHVYLAGSTLSTDRMAANGLDNTYNGAMDVYLAKFDGSGRRMWGSYLGGTGGEMIFPNSLLAQGTTLYAAFSTSSLAGIALNGHQNAYGGGPQDAALLKLYEPAPAPLVTGFSPTSGVAGTTVTLTGSYFEGVNQVEFNGVGAAFTVQSATRLTATVPAGATTGPIRVISPNGTGVTNASFAVAQPPLITGFTPGFGPAGTQVTVSGNYFTGVNRVEFDGTSAAYTVVSATQLTATVPSGAFTGPIRVTNAAGTATSTTSFYLPPVLTLVEPAEGTTGTAVTLRGYHLTTATQVLFNGVPTPFTTGTAGQLHVRVPAGAATGPIRVVTPGGAATGSNDFKVVYPPVLSGLTPATGPANSTVVISGSQLSYVTAVQFNGLNAEFTIEGDGRLLAIVPVDATSGPVTVRNLAGNAVSATSFTVIPSPRLLAHLPAKHEPGAVPDAPLSFSFSEAMQAAASPAAIKVHGSLTGLRSGDGTFSGAGTAAASFASRRPFYPGEKIAVSVTRAARNGAGIGLGRPVVYDFTAKAGPGPAAFLAGSGVDVGGKAYSVFPADLDGDGDVDLAVANSTTNVVSIRLNDGRANFTSGAELPAGSQLRFIRGGDLDGDGDVDLACLVNDGDNLAVFRNNGNATFGPATLSEEIFASYPPAFCLLDFDGDGDLDVAVSSNSYLSTLRNDGAGNLAAYHQYGQSMGTTGRRSLKAGDLDGDGDLDLVATYADNSSDAKLVYENDGAGKYALSTKLTVTGIAYPQSLDAGDFNNDGALDLAVMAYDPTAVYLRFNNGRGNLNLEWGSTINNTWANRPRTVCVGDFNGDGLADFVTGTYSNTLVLHTNTGAGTFARPVLFNVNTGDREMYAVDLDGDKDLDVVSTDGFYQPVYISLNNVTNPPVVTGFVPAGRVVGSPMTIRGTDLWGATAVTFNGTPAAFTLVNGNEITATVPAGATTGPVRVTTGNGTATSPASFVIYPAPYLVLTGVQPVPRTHRADPGTSFTFRFDRETGATAAAPAAIRVYGAHSGSRVTAGGTFSGGGTGTISFDPALGFGAGELVQVTLSEGVVSTAGTPLEKPYVYAFRTANAPATLAFRANLPAYSIRGPRAMGLADFNGDENVDVALLAGQVAVHLNDGAGVWSRPLLTAADGNCLQVADWDGDGDPDLAVGRFNGSSSTVEVLTNDGKAHFTGKGALPNPGVRDMGAADLDGDGDFDLVAGSNSCPNCDVPHPATLTLHWNDGTGDLSRRDRIEVGSSILFVSTGDFNGDGSADIAVATEDRTLLIYHNDGRGRFNRASRLEVGGDVRGKIHPADLDNDGDLDLLLARQEYITWQDGLLLFRNDGKGGFTRTVAMPGSFAQGQVGDYDGDGDVDFAVTGTSQGIDLWLNDGNAGFTRQKTAATGFDPHLIGSADFDADGTADLLAVASETAGRVQTILNQSPLPLTTLGSVAPTSGTAGTPVVIRGSHFTGTTRVKFNGVPADFTVDNDGQITALAPAGAGRGYVVVYAPGGAAVSPGVFVVTVPGTLLSVSPAPDTHTAPTGAPVAFSFRSAMHATAASGEAIKVFGGLAGGRSGSFTGGGTPQVAFQPARGFLPGERVSVTLTTAARRQDGTPLEKPYVYSFRAAAAPSDLASFTASPPVLDGYVNTVCLADFNGDGTVDYVATVHQYTVPRYDFVVAFNDGTGHFPTRATIAETREEGPRAVLARDLDGDGDMDLATTTIIAGSTFYNCSTYLNDGRGHFTAGRTFKVGEGSNGLQGDDIDGDGDLDLLLMNGHNDGRVFVLRNDGAANFTVSETRVIPNRTDMKTADMDGDGDVDLVTMGRNGDSSTLINLITLWLNDGSGTFREDRSVEFTEPAPKLLVNDFTGDGYPDVMLPDDKYTRLLRNDGVGNLTPLPAVPLPFANAASYWSEADFDGDGDLDLTTGTIDNKFHFLLNDGKGNFANIVTRTAAKYPVHAYPADFDGDGDVDFLTCDYTSLNEKAYILLNGGTGDPQLTGFSPAAGAPGTSVVVTGWGLNRAEKVYFNGVEAVFAANGPTTVRATVPAGATSGPISLLAGGQTYSSRETFTVLSAAPSGLTASVLSATGVRLAWVDQSGTETGFEVYRSTEATAGFVKVATVAANETAFEDTGLAARTGYYYRVAAVYAGGTSGYSNVAAATTLPVPPAPPAHLSATAVTATGLALHWTPGDGEATGYRVERSAGDEAHFAEVGVAEGSDANHYPDAGLLPGTTYYYRVRAVNAGGFSAHSAPLAVVTLPEAPAAPGNLAAHPAGTAEVRLTWADHAGNETGYAVYRSVNGAAYEPLATLGADVTGYTDGAVQADTPYAYKVRASNAGGHSAFSNEVQITLTALPTPPAAPGALTAAAVSFTAVELAWTGATGEAGYVVERSSGDSTHFEVVATVAPGTTGYRDTTVNSGTTYYYRVKAYTATAESAYAPAVAINPAVLVAAPTGLVAVPVFFDQVDLSWEDPSGLESGFLLERSRGDNQHYLPIALVGANVTTYQDTALTAGTTYYYRVKAMYPPAHSKYSAEAVVTTPGHATLAEAVTVYPNPSAGAVNVSLDTPYPGEVRVVVFNEIGYALQTWTVTKGDEKKTFVLHLETLRTGMYYLQVITAEGTVVKPMLKL
ncbi:MAG: hypothetical protein AVDCRST_MAG56-538 [uncultured Cytophagales bacterium]|uniref:Fibronectin type-III domain-containing protein n=1 Tax=uncultured Cytophagales bacterium TaxID=158755 RepID=A0A6J4HGZ6_9SPHI|nr:MAG: hypothetical protein AVDCRST_MAG56-538 [uncultured Cytophagales bacterium]